MLASLIRNNKFKVALAVAGAIAIGLNIYETYQSIQLNKVELQKNQG